MKKCFKCGVIKPLDEFYKHSQMLDGHLNKCKECAKKDVRKNRTDKLEYYQEYDRNRSSLPQRVSLRKKVSGKWLEDGRHAAAVARHKKRFPEKYSARNKVNHAIHDGRLTPPTTCSMCGKETVNIHAHHADYSKPLEVMWLCTECHGKEHRKYPRKPKTINKRSVSA